MWLSDTDKAFAILFEALFHLIDSIIHDLLLENIINTTFQNQTSTRQPTSTNFLDDLEHCHFTDSQSEKTCAICQVDFEKEEDIITLPCGHCFHGNGNECPGIIPWLKDNNTCPMCKHELPSNTVISETNDNDDNLDIRPLLDDEINEIINNIIINILNGEQPSIRDIQINNHDLIDTIRTNIHNSIV
jgi:hypothetical protein